MEAAGAVVTAGAVVPVKAAGSVAPDVPEVAGVSGPTGPMGVSGPTGSTGTVVTAGSLPSSGSVVSAVTGAVVAASPMMMATASAGVISPFFSRARSASDRVDSVTPPPLSLSNSSCVRRS